MLPRLPHWRQHSRLFHGYSFVINPFSASLILGSSYLVSAVIARRRRATGSVCYWEMDSRQLAFSEPPAFASVLITDSRSRSLLSVGYSSRSNR